MKKILLLPVILLSSSLVSAEYLYTPSKLNLKGYIQDIPNPPIGTSKISCGDKFCYAIKDTTLWVLGHNDKNRLGIGGSSRLSWTKTTHTGVTDIATGSYHGLMIKNGNAWFAGWNYYGQAGNGTYNGNDEYSWRDTGESAIGIGASWGTSYIIKPDNTLWATGFNNYGQFGIGSSTYRYTNYTYTGKTADKIVGAKYHAAYIRNGNLYFSGANHTNQSGLNSGSEKIYSWTLASEGGVTDLFMGYEQSSYIIKNGTLWVAGSNGNGILGLGHNNDVPSWTDTNIPATTAALNGGFGLVVSEGDVLVTGVNLNGQFNLSNLNTWTSTNQTGVTEVHAPSCSMMVKNDNMHISGPTYYCGAGENTTYTEWTEIQSPFEED